MGAEHSGVCFILTSVGSWGKVLERVTHNFAERFIDSKWIAIYFGDFLYV